MLLLTGLAISRPVVPAFKDPWVSNITKAKQRYDYSARHILRMCSPTTEIIDLHLLQNHRILTYTNFENQIVFVRSVRL